MAFVGISLVCYLCDYCEKQFKTVYKEVALQT